MRRPLLQRESSWWAVLFFCFLAIAMFATDWQTVVFGGTCAMVSLFLGIGAEIEDEL